MIAVTIGALVFAGTFHLTSAIAEKHLKERWLRTFWRTVYES